MHSPSKEPQVQFFIKINCYGYNLFLLNLYCFVQGAHSRLMKAWTISLDEGQLWRPDFRGTAYRLRCVRGRVWATRAGDAEDHILDPGEALEAEKEDGVLVEALTPAEIVVGPAAAMSEAPAAPTVSRLGLYAAFAAVYLIWGSTYLAIHYAIQTLPPFLMAGARFFLSGLILAVGLLARGGPRPARADWRGAAIVGVLLLAGGNGSVVWAQQRVPSGVAAVLIATTPFWMIFLDRLSGGLKRISPLSALAALAGFAGVFVLLFPKGFGGVGAVPLVPALAILGAAFWWSLGSTLSRYMRMPASPWWSTALQMLCGGAFLLVLGTLRGEWGDFDPARISAASAAAWLYLIFFGSIVGYSAYLWILRHSTPTRVSTYAFVNPVVALLLGWAVAGESLGPRTLLAAALILPSVVILIGSKEERRDRRARGGKIREGLDSSVELT